MKTLEDRKKIASDLTTKVESMFDSFGMKVRVQSVTFEKRSILLESAVAGGVRVEDIEGLSKTIAMTVSSPTGEVEVVAPLPGTSHIGIRVPMTNGRSVWKRFLKLSYWMFGVVLIAMLTVGFSNTMYQLVSGTGKESPAAVGLYFVLIPIILTVVIVKAGTIWFDAKFRSRGHKG